MNQKLAKRLEVINKNKWLISVPEKRLAEECQSLVLFNIDIGSLERGIELSKYKQSYLCQSNPGASVGEACKRDLAKAGKGPVQWQIELNWWHMQNKTYWRGRQNICVTGSI